MRSSQVDVLHVPFTYWPDHVGGTEIYVRALMRELRSRGLDCAVAAPGRPAAGDGDVDVDVHRWTSGIVDDAAHGRPDPFSAAEFRKILARTRPGIVHLHARTSAVSRLLLEEARSFGARTVFTYHTASASCMRGTMMLGGRAPCDGTLDATRCAACTLEKHGVPPWAAKLLATAPEAARDVIARLGLSGGLWLALRMRGLAEMGRREFFDFMGTCDRVVAVCEWVAEVLRRNGVVEPQLVLCRQGLPFAPEPSAAARPAREAASPVRVHYYGRLERAKGLDILIGAVSLTPDTTLDIFGIDQGDTEIGRLIRETRMEGRLRLHPPLDPREVVSAMRQADVVAVPSTGLETGPLVVLEAFAAGVPVVGSRLGGIAELVTHELDGLLVAPGDVASWATSLSELAADRRKLARLRSGVRPPRTMADVATEMAGIYETLTKRPVDAR